MKNELRNTNDPGSHYRHEYKVPLKVRDVANGYAIVKLDPFRIAEIYEMDCFALQTILKKTLKAGERGHKDLEQDLKDIICAAQRKLEMLEEDKEKNRNGKLELLNV